MSIVYLIVVLLVTGRVWRSREGLSIDSVHHRRRACMSLDWFCDTHKGLIKVP